MKTVLGTEMHSAQVAVLGVISEQSARMLLKEMVALIGMQTGGLEPHVWRYPLPGGGGGQGETIVQPVLVVQPLLESEAKIILGGSADADTWQELGGWYLILNSCRPFDINAVLRFLWVVGYRVSDWAIATIRLHQTKGVKDG
jgi:hypothetical protein